jgi:hypothetical protein
MNFSFSGRKFKLKYELLQNFELHSFGLTRFYCSLVLMDGVFPAFRKV